MIDENILDQMADICEEVLSMLSPGVEEVSFTTDKGVKITIARPSEKEAEE